MVKMKKSDRTEINQVCNTKNKGRKSHKGHCS